MASGGQPEQLSVCLRTTFIHVRGQAVEVPRRSRSEEPRPRPALDGELDGEAEKSYFRDLSGKWAAVNDAQSALSFFTETTSGPSGSGAHRGRTPGVDGSGSGEGSGPPLPDLGGDLPLPSPTEEPLRRGRRTAARESRGGLSAHDAGINNSVMGMLLQAKAQGSSSKTHTATDVASAPPAPAMRAPAAPGPVAPASGGSVGHPELCNRACMYFKSGECSLGDQCQYCHLEHTKRTAHLDKRHREMLRALSPVDWAQLVFPILHRKVLALDKSGVGSRMVDEMAALAGVPVYAVQPAAPQRSQRMLVLTLRAMNLKSLISTIHRGLIPESEPLEGIARELLQYLRRLSLEP